MTTMTRNRFYLSAVMLAVLSAPLLAAAGDDVVGPRDESKIGCPEFTTRKPVDGEIQVTTAPMNLDKPGKYILMNDISVEASAFAITSSGVTFDLNGYTITYGTGVKNIVAETKNQGVMTYMGLQNRWQKKIGRGNDVPVGPVSKNLGHSAIIANRAGRKTQDWPDGTFSWNYIKGLVVKNGRITHVNG